MVQRSASWQRYDCVYAGTLTYDNGDELTGTFENGSLTEEHVVMYKWRDGSVFNGWFRNNQPNKGSVTHANGDKWEI
jgi:hypothetical protein